MSSLGCVYECHIPWDFLLNFIFISTTAMFVVQCAQSRIDGRKREWSCRFTAGLFTNKNLFEHKPIQNVNLFNFPVVFQVFQVNMYVGPARNAPLCVSCVCAVHGGGVCWGRVQAPHSGPLSNSAHAARLNGLLLHLCKPGGVSGTEATPLWPLTLTSDLCWICSERTFCWPCGHGKVKIKLSDAYFNPQPQTNMKCSWQFKQLTFNKIII